MKKIIAWVSSVVLMLSLVAGIPVVATELMPEMIIGDAAGAAGDTVGVNVVLENNPGISSIVLKIDYDKTRLTLDSVTISPRFADDAYQNVNLPYVTFVRSGNVAENDVLLTLVFTVKSDATAGDAYIDVLYEEGDITNCDEEDVNFEVRRGRITVGCAHRNIVEVPQEPADCDSVGYTTGVYCNDCKTYISGHEEIPATNNHVDADGKWEADENAHFRTCECGVTYDRAPHSGGSANCTQKAKCEVCGQEYGKLNEEQHGQTEIRDAVEATATKPGYTGDIYCKECGDLVATGEEIAAVSNLSVRAVGNISYTISGRTVTVSHKLACKLGYLSNGSYVAIPTVANGDGSYSFDVPENVTEVLLVVKGDVNGDGKISSSDYSRLNAVLLKKTALTVEATFAADCNVDGKISSSDYSRLNAVLLQKTTLTW